MKGSAVVIGAGVAGLSTSIALRRTGFDVAAFERAPGPASAGMGFLLMENGLASLERLGLADRARARGVVATGSRTLRPDGTVVGARSFAPHVGMARDALVEILLEALPERVVRFGCEIDPFDPEDGTLGGGGGAGPGIWVGADGHRSAVRRHVAPAHRLLHSHVAELISCITAPDLVAELGSTLVRVRHPSCGLGAGIVPVSKATLVWYVTHDTRRWSAGEDADSRRRFAEIVSDWPWPLPELVLRTDFGASYVWHTADMDPLEELFRGEVVLVGDAAHPLQPFSTQGVNSALVDAVTLADALATEGGPGDGLRTWSRSRRQVLRSYLEYGRARAAAFLDPIHSPADPPFPENAGRTDLEVISRTQGHA